MKGQVYILLLASLVFISETILVPSKMVMGRQGLACCLAMDMKSPCSHCGHSAGSPDRSAKGSNGRNEGSNSRNEGGSGCNNTANCTNCPLCYTATFLPFYHSSTLYVTGKPDYPVIPGKRVAGYYTRSWKPPDAGLFS